MVITFKYYLEESTKVHPELAAHGIDAEAVKKFLHMRKTELDGSGLESRGEKMKHTRAKNAFFNHLDKIHNGDEKKVRLAYHKLSTMHDDKGEKSLYEAIEQREKTPLQKAEEAIMAGDYGTAKKHLTQHVTGKSRIKDAHAAKLNMMLRKKLSEEHIEESLSSTEQELLSRTRNHNSVAINGKREHDAANKLVSKGHAKKYDDMSYYASGGAHGGDYYINPFTRKQGLTKGKKVYGGTLYFHENLEEARVSTQEKPTTQVRETDLKDLLGKGAFNSLVKHPWMKDWSAYDKAWKHGVDRAGFHTVEMYPYMASMHTTEKGVRPEFMLQFNISHFGGTGRVTQVQKFQRGKEENSEWKHVKSWKDTSK